MLRPPTLHLCAPRPSPCRQVKVAATGDDALRGVLVAQKERAVDLYQRLQVGGYGGPRARAVRGGWGGTTG
jgi:hypothetical protein